MTVTQMRQERRFTKSNFEPRRRAANKATWWFMSATAGFSGLFIVLPYLYLSGDLYIILRAVFVVLLFPGVVGFIFFTHLYLTELDHTEIASVSEPPKKKESPFRMGTRAGGKIRIGSYRFTPEQWRALGKSLDRNNWKLTRDVLQDAEVDGSKLFPNITKNWPDVRAKWSRLEWIDDKNQVSFLMRDNLMRFIIGSPAPINGGPSSADSNDDDGDGRPNYSDLLLF